MHDRDADVERRQRRFHPAGQRARPAESTSNFGNSVINSRYDDEVLTQPRLQLGGSASVQHELVAARVGQRRLFPPLVRQLHRHRQRAGHAGRLQPVLRHGAARSAAARRRRLPVCGLYDISAAKFGQSNNVVTLATNFGDQHEIYNGVDVSVNARLPRGVVVSGGTSTGRVAHRQLLRRRFAAASAELRRRRRRSRRRSSARGLPAAVVGPPDEPRRSRACRGRRSPRATRPPTRKSADARPQPGVVRRRRGLQRHGDGAAGRARARCSASG